MSDVQFEDRSIKQNISAYKQPSGFQAKLIKYGLAKDEKSADTILIIIAVVAFTLAIIVII